MLLVRLWGVEKGVGGWVGRWGRVFFRFVVRLGAGGRRPPSARARAAFDATGLPPTVLRCSIGVAEEDSKAQTLTIAGSLALWVEGGA